MPPASHPNIRILYTCDTYIKVIFPSKMWKFLGVLFIATTAFADRTFLQNLLDTDLQEEALLSAYDKHYDALSQEDKLREKATYPDDVYSRLLDHRSKRVGLP